MPGTLRAVAFVAGVCVLYVMGYVAMTATKPPWGLVWLPPLAVLAGIVWTWFEHLDARMHRHARERERERERGAERAANGAEPAPKVEVPKATDEAPVTKK